MGYVKLIQPSPRPQERDFVVEVTFRGDWSTQYAGDWPTAYPPGVLRFSIEQFAYMGAERGPRVEGTVSVSQCALTEHEAVQKGVQRIEAMPGLYPGFLSDALAYEVNVRHEKYPGAI